MLKEYLVVYFDNKLLILQLINNFTLKLLQPESHSGFTKKVTVYLEKHGKSYHKVR